MYENLNLQFILHVFYSMVGNTETDYSFETW